MLPEVKEYFDVVDKAQTEHKKACKDLQDSDSKFAGEWYLQHDRLDRELFNTRITAKRTLQNNARHPVIVWLTDPKNEVFGSEYYWTHAEKLMRLLPATEAEINKFAQEDKWCGTWDQFRNKALADGVLDGYIELQYQQNNQPWRNFDRRTIRMTDGEVLTRKEIMQWFKRGAKSFEFQIRRSTYRFKVVQTDPYA